MSGGDGGALTFRVLPFDVLDSTNEEARRRLGAAAPAGTVVWARRQQAGRGRRGRAWVSEEGNLFCSIILRPDCPPAEATQLSLAVALAVADTAAAVLGKSVPVAVKWPNDVLVGGRKLAGILLESDGSTMHGATALVVGVGINVAHAPAATEFPATSLAEAGVVGLTVEAVLARLLDRLLHWYRLWCAEGLGPVRSAWLQRAAGLGGPVTVRLHGETLYGSFIGLDDGGALLLDPAGGGPVRRVAAGDVFFSPPSC